MNPINWAAIRNMDAIGREIFATSHEPEPTQAWFYERQRSPAAQELLDARKYAKDAFEREILTWEAERLDSLP